MVIISVSRNGDVWLGSEQIMVSSVAERIRYQSSKFGPPKRIYVKADAYAKYRSVTAVLEQVRAAGIENVSFIASPWSGLQQ